MIKFTTMRWPCQLQTGTCHGQLPFTSTRIKPCAATAADCQHSLKGAQGGEQEWGRLLAGLILKLKLQYFGHLKRRADSLEKTLMWGKIEGRRRRGPQRMSWMASPTPWTWIWASFRSWWWTGKPGMLQFMGSQRIGHDWGTELDLLYVLSLFFIFWS